MEGAPNVAGGRLARRLMLAAAVAGVVGSACAGFLAGLDWVTAMQWRHPELLWGLPAAGFAIAWLYQRVGKGSERGNNLVIDEIHEPGGGVPARMAPLVLLGTWVSHLFGGPVGREGTAVQIGGSVAAWLARVCRIDVGDRPLLLQSGIAAGFGAVFGTPVAGAVFAMEVLAIGRIRYDALLPVMLASVLGDMTCAAWGVHHTVYDLNILPPDLVKAPTGLLLLGKVVLAAMAFGLAGRLFAWLAHAVQRSAARLLPYAPLRPALGGLAIIALTMALGTRDYLGLGIIPPPGGQVSILAAFEPGGAAPLSWWWKCLFTALAVGSGFKGGEVTPLFFIGATLGHVLALWLQEPIALFAALGFVAVFAGAANTPLACTLMGVELFGAQFTAPLAIACFVSYACSGHQGIYRAQRMAVPKIRPGQREGAGGNGGSDR